MCPATEYQHFICSGAIAMSTIDFVTSFGQTAAPMRRALGLFEKYLSLLYEWHQRNVLRGAMYNLSDRELQDIGATRGDIECVARSHPVAPRGVRPI
jgi:uncharacterized protein YjiS (DUF1127 family)